MSEKQELFKQYFGHSTFRRGQEPLMDALLSGRDVLGVMPTGAGKSACYQLPALMLSGITLVISPLISLMKDQVTALTQSGIPAAFLNSSLTERQYYTALSNIEKGKYKIIYVAPERLQTYDFFHTMQTVEISLVAVDEAHCVSQWGQDFRPNYLKIAEFIDTLPNRPAVGAFTATATERVKKDIRDLLHLKDPLCITTGFDRPNLYFSVERPKNKDEWIKNYLSEHTEESGIIYCASRKGVETLCDSLRKQGISATRYHAGLSDEERRQNQEDFVFDRARIMTATNAFGMGIDKSNVSFVLHYNMPKNIESYYQEAGRAGRDGEKAECILLFSERDVNSAEYLIRNSASNEELSFEERETVQNQDRKRLQKMISYCKTTGCLRNYLLNYFGEETERDCGNCGNCNSVILIHDITTEAQKIFSAIIRAERKVPSGIGKPLLVWMLLGRKEPRLTALGLDTLSTFGIMKEEGKDRIKDYIDFFLEKELLTLTDGRFPNLRITEKAEDVLFHGRKVYYSVFKKDEEAERENRKEKQASRRKRTASVPAEEGSLFAALKALRFRLAQKAGLPAYIIFSNAALTDMADRQPETAQEFLQVSGVGKVKAEKYGEVFLKEIKNWKAQQGDL